MVHIFSMILALLTSLTLGTSSQAQTAIKTHALKNNAVQQVQTTTDVNGPSLNVSGSSKTAATASSEDQSSGKAQGTEKVAARNTKSDKDMPTEVSVSAIEHSKALVAITPTPSVAQTQEETEVESHDDTSVDAGEQAVFGQSTAVTAHDVAESDGRTFGQSISAQAKLKAKDK